MNPFRIFKTLIHNADFFSTTQLIRYQEEPEFKTFTGGIFSLAIVGVIAAIFFSMSIKTLNRESIFWSSQTIKQSEPDPITISFREKQIGIELQGFNLTASKQFFDITLSLFSYYNKDPNPVITSFPLEACKRENWNYNEEILGNFDKMHGENWLCPPINSTFTIMGKYTSADYAYLSFDIMKCGSVKQNVTCASASEIDAVLANQVYLSIYYVNSLIAADQAEPVTYYLEDKDYIAFGKNLGAYGYIYISDYQIATDESILPYTNINNTKGDIVVVPTAISVQETTSNWFSSFVFLKSTNRYEYTRSFTKFDTVISYTGGLFGAIIGILFLMNHYTRLSFQLVLGSHMYNDDNNQPLRIKSLNFFRYIGFAFYGFLQSIGCNVNWKVYQSYQRCRSEIQKHLDIRFILQKLIFLQRSIYMICGEDKYKTLHLKSKCTISQAKKYREFYFLKSIIISSISKRFKDIEAESANEKSKNVENQMKIEKIAAEHLGKRISDRIRNGKVFPIEIQSEVDQMERSGKPFRDEIRQGQRSKSKMMKTMKYALTCIEQKKQNNSSELPSQFQYKLDEDLMKSLAQVKKEADSGEITSMAIWSSIQDDIRLIIEECLYQREESNSFMQCDAGNPQNQMVYPPKKRRGKVQFC